MAAVKVALRLSLPRAPVMPAIRRANAKSVPPPADVSAVLLPSVLTTLVAQDWNMTMINMMTERMPIIILGKRNGISVVDAGAGR